MENPENETDSDWPPPASTSTAQKKTQDAEKIKTFTRQPFAEPYHVILSSPFVRRIAMSASYLCKPPWYKMPDSFEFALFKELLDVVDMDRGKYVDFPEMVIVLQEIDPTITVEEVVDVISELDRTKTGEIDFGEFFYALANSKHYRQVIERNPLLKKVIGKKKFNPRQCSLYSLLAYYVFVQCPGDVHRYYTDKTRRRGAVLDFHMECARLQGLSEKQMEVKQLQARYANKKLKKISDSPFSMPSPFVPAFCRNWVYTAYLKSKAAKEKSEIEAYYRKKPIKRPITPFKTKRELGDKMVWESREERIIHEFENGKITLPKMKMPRETLLEMRYRVDENAMPYLTKVAKKAMNEYRDRLVEGSVLHAKKILETELKRGFPNDDMRFRFTSVFEMYMPTKARESHLFYPYTPPTMWVNYQHYKKAPAIERPPFGFAAS